MSQQNTKVSTLLSPSLDLKLNNLMPELIFAKPSDKDFDPNSSINLSRFGFQDPDSIRKFLLTPAGNTVKAELNERVAQEDAIAEKNRVAYREEQTKKELIKAHLILWLLFKDSQAKDRLRALINEQNQKTLDKNKISSATPQQEARMRQLNESIDAYEAALGHTELKLNALNLRVDDFIHQQANFESKFETFTDTLAIFDQEYGNHEKSPIEQLEQEIKSLEATIESMTEQVGAMLDAGDEDGARKFMNQQNSLGLYLEGLYDLRASKDDKKEKVFLDENCNPVTSQKEATFALPKQHKLVKQDGKYYLLNKDDQIENLSSEAKAKAAQRFEKEKHAIKTVKESVKDSLKAEKAFHEERIHSASIERDNTKAEKEQLQNQLNALRIERGPVPRLTPAPPSIWGALEKLLTPQFIKTVSPPNKVTPQDFLKKVDKNIEDRKLAPAVNHWMKQLLDELGLKTGAIFRNAPIPDESMKSLLRHAAYFAVNQYLVNPQERAKMGPQMSPPPTPIPKIEDKLSTTPRPSPYNTWPR